VRRSLKHTVLTLILASFSLPASAIIILGGDGYGNTNAPVGSLEGSGWQFQGRFNTFLGTPIGPHHFIAAKHIGGSVGNKFYYGDEVFTTIGSVVDAGSDLRIWEVAERLPSYAPLYFGTDEGGKGLVVFGRGVDRGVVVTNTITTGKGKNQETIAITNGWKWGSYNYVQRWGTNVVSAVAIVDGYPVIVADWDAGAGDNECMLAAMDSSGGIFIQENGVWKLAGINYAVGPATTYSFNSDGSLSFKAAILDFSGNSPLYTYDGTNWVTTGSLGMTKSSFYASRISSRYSWITNNVTDFDQDVDGLPDWWELTYTNSATILSAVEDSDGDNFSNLQEWYADTDPTDMESFPVIGNFRVSSNQTFTFDGSTSRQYQVNYTLDTGITWLTHEPPVWGAGTNTQIVVTNTEDSVFYRLQVTLP
jgi:hypothetical protein